MNFKNILVPYDGSEFSLHALQAAMNIVTDKDDARLCVLTVIPTPEAGSGRAYDSNESASGTLDFEDFHRTASVATEHAKKSLAQDVGIELDILGGKGAVDAVASPNTARGILGYSQIMDCDLIVMGQRGFQSHRGTLGSVCSAVASSSPVPVLVVR